MEIQCSLGHYQTTLPRASGPVGLGIAIRSINSFTPQTFTVTVTLSKYTMTIALALDWLCPDIWKRFCAWHGFVHTEAMFLAGHRGSLAVSFCSSQDNTSQSIMMRTSVTKKQLKHFCSTDLFCVRILSG